MNEVESLLVGLIGYSLQWMRGFRWFSDGVTLLVCLIGGLLATLLMNEPGTIKVTAFILATLKSTLAFLGGTMLGHMAANSGSPVMLAPRFNSFNEGGNK